MKRTSFAALELDVISKEQDDADRCRVSITVKETLKPASCIYRLKVHVLLPDDTVTMNPELTEKAGLLEAGRVIRALGEYLQYQGGR